MVQKARLFGDEKVAQMMLTTTDPKEHKAMGRMVKGFNERVWNESMLILLYFTPLHDSCGIILCGGMVVLTGFLDKLKIVTEGNYLKFTASEHADVLKKELMETGDRELVEASPFDRIWGIGFREADAEKNRHKWGENLLGRAVMDVRERLRKEEGEKKGAVEKN